MKRLLFTVVFTIFGLIFYTIMYYIFKTVYPEWLRVPSTISTATLARTIGIFTVIVLLSFIGANSVVYGNASGRTAEKKDDRK